MMGSYSFQILMFNRYIIDMFKFILFDIKGFRVWPITQLFLCLTSGDAGPFLATALSIPQVVLALVQDWSNQRQLEIGQNSCIPSTSTIWATVRFPNGKAGRLAFWSTRASSARSVALQRHRANSPWAKRLAQVKSYLCRKVCQLPKVLSSPGSPKICSSPLGLTHGFEYVQLILLVGQSAWEAMNNSGIEKN